MLFLILSDADVNFLDWEFRWRTYTTKKTLSTTKRVELVAKKEFATPALDLEHKTFVIEVTFFSFTPFDANVHLFRRPQISGLIVKKAPIKIFDKYVDFTNVFSLDLAFKLSKHPSINNHTIKLGDSQQPLYGSIYGLRLIELELLKAYLKINLTNGFIRPFKSLAGAPILFNRKSNRFL